MDFLASINLDNAEAASMQPELAVARYLRDLAGRLESGHATFGSEPGVIRDGNGATIGTYHAVETV